MGETKITEKTLVPLSLVVSLIGGTTWLTQLHFNQQANAAAIVELRTEQKELSVVVREIHDHMTWVRARLADKKGGTR